MAIVLQDFPILSLTSSEYLNPVNTQTWTNGRHVVICCKV